MFNKYTEFSKKVNYLNNNNLWLHYILSKSKI